MVIWIYSFYIKYKAFRKVHGISQLGGIAAVISPFLIGIGLLVILWVILSVGSLMSEAGGSMLVPYSLIF